MFYILRFLVDLIYAVALYIGYDLGQRIGMKYLFTDMYIARMYCGFIGVAVVVFIFDKIKGTIIFFVKSVGLYSVSTGCSGADAFKNILKRLDKVIGVAAVTKILTEAISDVKNALIGDSPEDKIKEMFPILADLPFTWIISFLAKYYIKSFTFLDECILAYSFAMDKPIMKSLKDAFIRFLKKSKDIMVQLIMSSVTMSVINFAIAIIGIIFYFNKIVFSLKNIIIFYIVIRAAIYIIDDAFIEPLLLKQVILDYVEDMPTASEELEKNMSSLIDDTDESATCADSETVNETEDAEEAVNEINALLNLPAVKRLLAMADTNKGES